MIRVNGKPVFNKGVFPNGEVYYDVIKDWVYKDKNRVYFKFEKHEEIADLIFIKSCIDSISNEAPCYLILPYIPYSRMDRAEENRLFTLKYFANILNSLHFTRVYVMEPHSDVSVALIDRITVVNYSMTLAKIAMRDAVGFESADVFSDINMNYIMEKARKSGVYLVYPDAGAEKRYSKQLSYDKVLTATKHRDFNTGNITSINVNGLENAPDLQVAIIVDDLCSKGGTFMGVAKAIREGRPNIEHIALCVTHCENTIVDGDILRTDVINRVRITDSIFDTSHYDEVIEGVDKYKMSITSAESIILQAMPKSEQF